MRHYVLLETNRIIKMVASNHIGNASTIIVECMILRDGVLTVKKTMGS